MHISFKLVLLFSLDNSSGIARSYSSPSFNFLRKLHTVFHSDCTNLHFYQLLMRVSFLLHHHQYCHLLFFFFLIIVILTGIGMRWYLLVVLICIFLMFGDVEHLFTCLVAICVSSLEKCLFRPSAHFLIRVGFSFFTELYEFYVLCMLMGMLSHFSRVWLIAILWIERLQAPLSMGFSRQEYWSELPCPPPGNLHDPWIEPTSFTFPALGRGFFATGATWEAHILDSNPFWIYALQISSAIL